MRSLTLSALLLALPACGDSGGDTTSTTTTGPGTSTDVTTGDSASSTDEPTTDDATTVAPETGSVTMTSTTTGETGDTTTGDATTGDATTGDTPDTTADVSSSGTTGDTTGDTTGGGVSELEIAIVDAELWADCQPVVDPDPAMGSWFVEFTNNGAAETSATVIKASLSLAVDPPMIEPISVSPTDSGPLPPGETTSLEVKKLKGAAHSACEHCGEFYLLALEYQEGDVTHVVTEDVTISCAF
jgi:hypothetical protein